MGQPEQDSITFRMSNVGDGGGCDESKCVSKGRANLYNDSNMCYGDDGTFFPMMCADGFLPVVVENEPPSVHSSWYGDIPVSYFTCCPPSEIMPNATAVTRQCSDPITGRIDIEYDNDDDATNATICYDNTRKYPRRMKTSWGILAVGTFGITPSKTDSYLCCDSDNEESVEQNFLDSLECVPYRNEAYESRMTQNLVGILRVISCDFPDGDFVFPRPVGEAIYSDVVSTGRYQCCKSGPALPPFIQDSAFKKTVYIPLAIWCLAAAISTLVCVALLIPLAKERWNVSQKRNSSSTRMRQPCYSTYNLYLVYLFFFDIVYSLFQIGWYGSYINQKFNPRFYSVVASPTNLVYTVTIIRAPDGPITYAYVFINMWINAVISFQLLDLLKKSKRSQKMRQPSIGRVNLQVGIIFSLSMLYGYILYALSDAATTAGRGGDFDTVERLSTTVQILWIWMLILPIAFIGVICCFIWLGNYIPSLNSESSTRDKAMRQLFFFFLRIVAVFYCIFFPAIVIVIVGVVKFTPWYFLLSWCLLAFQPILSTCLILTKFDVKKYILDLVALSCLFDIGGKNKLASSNGFVVVSNDLESTKFSGGRMSSIGTFGASAGIYPYSNDMVEEEDNEDESSIFYSVLGFRPTENTNAVTQTGSN
eukprot:CAMPEP_0116127054 /NCGR_PEP_ID=MMETSP0329-20121206/6644_1 /TAXON_ID=697910 /ORGANISM="Pseudo-nitzschia arenysensis, Strain B593" /LENGTH=648 /DNA_ID=CAMNT_0003621145 /DNA_START=135 /DNA_END=2081 /DNA_ORIENTATION=+